MLGELAVLLTNLSSAVTKDEYWHAIVEENVLGKQTLATRRLTAQRLSELYGFDAGIPLFRVLRQFWQDDQSGRPLLAIVCALSRDPLLRATAEPVLALAPGEELSRQKMTDAVRAAVGGRLNDSTLDKVVRNASSSWAQSGHLQGRVRKFRRSVRATPHSTTLALLAGYLEGKRGGRLFNTLWTQVLDSSPADLRQFATEARRLGHLDLKIASDVVDIGVSRLLTPKEIQDTRGTH